MLLVPDEHREAQRADYLSTARDSFDRLENILDMITEIVAAEAEDRG